MRALHSMACSAFAARKKLYSASAFTSRGWRWPGGASQRQPQKRENGHLQRERHEGAEEPKGAFAFRAVQLHVARKSLKRIRRETLTTSEFTCCGWAWPNTIDQNQPRRGKAHRQPNRRRESSRHWPRIRKPARAAHSLHGKACSAVADMIINLAANAFT